jgi:hypothetical protein
MDSHITPILTSVLIVLIALIILSALTEQKASLSYKARKGTLNLSTSMDLSRMPSETNEMPEYASEHVAEYASEHASEHVSEHVSEQFAPRTIDNRFRTSDNRFRTSDNRFRTSDNRFRTINNRFRYAKQNVIDQIYKLLYITDKLFTENGIEYWMDGGTFLGAVRHKGLIPWDDDGDLQVWEDDERRIRGLRPQFAARNIVLKHTWFGYKLYFRNAERIEGHQWLYPALDLFPVRIEKDKLVYSYPKARRMFSGCYHDLETIYPLKRYEFGPIQLLGASVKDIVPYFDRCYGSDWNTHAYQIFDHANEKMMEKIKIKLTTDEKKPALPIDFNDSIR